VGSFTCVELGVLVTTYGAAIQGSWLAGSRLEITSIPLVGGCPVCQAAYTLLPSKPIALPVVTSTSKRSFQGVNSAPVNVE